MTHKYFFSAHCPYYFKEITVFGGGFSFFYKKSGFSKVLYV
jgi:hypothetical protein